MKPRFNVGLQFMPYMQKHPRLETIVDIHTTTNLAGEVIRIDYITEHDFMGQPVRASYGDTSIARSLHKMGQWPLQVTQNDQPT